MSALPEGRIGADPVRKVSVNDIGLDGTPYIADLALILLGAIYLGVLRATSVANQQVLRYAKGG